MPDSTHLEQSHCNDESQLEDGELQERTKHSRMTSNTSYTSQLLSRQESREQLRSGSNLSVLSGANSITSRSSRSHLEQNSHDESEGYGNSSVRRKPKGTHGSVSSHSFADSHSSISTGGASRQSLAFELAAAMDPTETDQSSILDSLGLGDDDDEEEEIGYGEEDEIEAEMGDYTMREEMDEGDEVGASIDQRRRKASMESHTTRSSGWANASPRWHGGKASDSSPGKSGFNADGQLTPTRHTRKSSRSTILTTAPSPHKSLSFEMADEFAEEDAQGNVENFDDQADSYESDSSDAEERARVVLEAGLVSTAHFLSILKQSNTDYNPPPAGLAPLSNAKDITSDRQPAVEKLISEIVRTMTESVRDREAQIRELKEIEVALSHTDRRALAEVESLPMILQDIDFRTYIVGNKTREFNEEYSSADQSQPENQLETLEEEQVSGDGQITPLAHRGSAQDLRLASEESFDLLGQVKSEEAGPQTTPMNHLNQLKLVTTSLINSLNIINEHTQISRQTQTDVVRKLKGVRGLVTNWKADHESLEQSKDHIARWESELDLHHQEHPSFGKVRGKFEVQIKLATEEAEKLLDEASERARSLLLPDTISI
ncbi:hypothetical protein DFH28DRAFT_1092630 [Melampsora americana]|nr:hypothetical protein DFH28DRAFT_1092630 [Melampsora americana]